MPNVEKEHKSGFVVWREARDVFQRLYSGGVRNKGILAKASGRSVKTVSNWMRQVEKRGDLMPHFYKPTPWKFTPHVKHSLVQILAQHPNKRSPWLAKKLEAKYGVKFSEGGVRKALRDSGYSVKENKRTSLTKKKQGC